MKKQLSFLTKYFMTNVENSASRASRFENFIFEGEGWGHVLRSPLAARAFRRLQFLRQCQRLSWPHPLAFYFQGIKSEALPSSVCVVDCT